MTKTLTVTAVLVFCAIVGTTAWAQGPGSAYCTGNGQGLGGPGSPYCTGNGPGGGFGAGFGAGRAAGGQGWQARLEQVSDPALAGEIASLHQQVRARQWDYRAALADGQDTAALEQEIATLRGRLHELNGQAGLCTGTGPHAYGMGAGAGRGACVAAGRGFGQGRAWGQGRGMGYGRRGGGQGANCPRW